MYSMATKDNKQIELKISSNDKKKLMFLWYDGLTYKFSKAYWAWGSAIKASKPMKKGYSK